MKSIYKLALTVNLIIVCSVGCFGTNSNDSLIEELFARNYAEEQLQINTQQYNALSSAEKARIFH